MVKKFFQNWGPRITAIPVLCTEGIIDLGIYEGNVNAATFLDFVTNNLCPNLLPFNGLNPRSVVILGKERFKVLFKLKSKTKRRISSLTLICFRLRS